MSRKSNVPFLDVAWADKDEVGQVVNPGKCAFGYKESWLQSGASLSPLRVPFTNELHQGQGDAFDGLPGFLADCLPDVWGRTLMARDFASAGVTATALNKLAWVGSRSLGALTFKPPLARDNPAKRWEPIAPLVLAREAQAVLQKQPPEAFVHLLGAGTAGGNFPKATVALLPDGNVLCDGNVAKVLPCFPGARLGILKLDAEDDPTKPSTDGRLEKAYMEMARGAGLRVAKCEVLVQDDVRPRHHLFVERFDVVRTPMRRLHMMSLAGALETFQGLTYTSLFLATKRLTEDHEQVLEAVRRMVFNVRAGNADDHGKNHAFLFDRAENRWTLSPAFDLTLNFSFVRSFNGLSPSTFGPTPRKERMEELAGEVGVSAQQFGTIDAEVAAAVAKWNEFAAANNVAQADVLRAEQTHAAIRTVLDHSAAMPARRARKRRW
jgi:serine/threonine-protein kinase HipA